MSPFLSPALAAGESGEHGVDRAAGRDTRGRARESRAARSRQVSIQAGTRVGRDGQRHGLRRFLAAGSGRSTSKVIGLPAFSSTMVGRRIGSKSSRLVDLDDPVPLAEAGASAGEPLWMLAIGSIASRNPKSTKWFGGRVSVNRLGLDFAFCGAIGFSSAFDSDRSRVRHRCSASRAARKRRCPRRGADVRPPARARRACPRP